MRDDVDRWIEAELARLRIPGLAIAVIQRGKVVKMSAYGLASVEHAVATTVETRFRLDSLTKVFTSVAILQLAEQGKLQLDDRVSKYLDGTPAAWRNVTLRHLLGYAAGIKDDYAERFHGSMLVDYRIDDLTRYAMKQPLVSTPGERWGYTNLGYFLLTLVVERVSKLSFSQYVEERVFKPAGMTSSDCPTLDAVVPKLATSYKLDNGRLAVLRDYVVSQAGFGYCTTSTVGDLVSFDAALAAGNLLKPESLSVMWSPYRLNDGTTSTFGLGWWIGLHRTSPVMAMGGRTGTYYIRYPDHELAVVVLGNLEGTVGVSYKNIANELAGRFEPRLAVPSSSSPDPDPERTAAVKALLSSLARGEQPDQHVSPRFLATFPLALWKEALGDAFRQGPVSYLACDQPLKPWESFGVKVASNCYFRAGERADLVRVELGADGAIAMIDVD
jgi:CubicO group peptidase (beta-lactamase class C family)